MDTGKAAIAAVKGKDKTFTLSTGIRARFKVVPPQLIDAATSKFEYPPVPKFYNKDKDREEENPMHPEYKKQCAEIDRQRGLAGMDVMLIAGIELIDGVPDKSEWLITLKQLERLGHLDLSGYNLDDEIELEYVYKKFVAVGNTDFQKLASYSGIQAADMEAAERSF